MWRLLISMTVSSRLSSRPASITSIKHALLASQYLLFFCCLQNNTQTLALIHKGHFQPGCNFPNPNSRPVMPVIFTFNMLYKNCENSFSYNRIWIEQNRIVQRGTKILQKVDSDFIGLRFIWESLKM